MKTLNLSLYIILLSFYFSACKIDDAELRNFKLNDSTRVTPGGDIPGGGDNVGSAEFYFKGKLNGQSLAWPVDNTDQWTEGTAAHTIIDRDTTNRALAGRISKNVSTVYLPAIQIFFKTFHYVGFDFRESIFKNFVTPGEWPYAVTDDLIDDDKDVFIIYMDKDNNTYSSIGNQTGSKFNVISTTLMPEELGFKQKIKIKVKFSCKLYPETGTPLTLTDAEAVIFIQDM